MKRKFSLFLALILFFNLLGFAPQVFAKEELSYTVSVEDFSVRSSDGKLLIEAPGFSIYPTFSHDVPLKVLFYALPPGAKINSITADIISYRDVHLSEEKLFVSPGIEARAPLHKTNVPCLYFEEGKMRKWNFVKVYYAPFVPDGNNLRVFDRVNFKIDYEIRALSSIEISDTAFDSIASRLFENFETAKNWYKKPLVASDEERFDYLIVIPNSSLEPSLSEFIKYKEETDGFKVKVVSLSEINVQATGNTTEERMRNYIKDHYLEWGIKYVLLVGGPRTVPMCYMYPEPNEKRDEDGSTRYAGRTPTDFFYAELDSNWDYDKDGLPGEFGEDTDYIEDFYPDVFVGRIPFDDAESIRQVLSNAIKYENSEDSFRKSALLVGAMLYYAEEGTSRQDGALALNFAYENYLAPSGFKTTSLYEQEGTKPSIFKSDLPLTNENFVKEMKSGKYGLILWNAHGSPQYIARKYWVDVNNNGEVNSGEIRWIDLLTTTDLNGYKLAPSIMYSASCETAWPEKNNFAKVSLLRGASAYIGASRISYGGGTIDPILEGFVKHFASDNFGIGDALQISLFEAPHSQEADFVNLYDYNLYGDPSLRVNTSHSTGISVSSYSRNFTIYQGKEITTSIGIKLADGVTATTSYSVDVEGIQCAISKESLASSEEVSIKIKCEKDAPTGDFTLNLYVKNISGAVYGVPIHIKVLESKFSPYDLNQDGKIDENDLKILESCFGTSKGDANFNPDADFNGDGIINGVDLILFFLNYGG